MFVIYRMIFFYILRIELYLQYIRLKKNIQQQKSNAILS